MNDYLRQNRGDHAAYARYLDGMDASMRQKVALTAAHLLTQGRVADMGMGSGSGTHALAALYPSLAVVGVDVNPAMIEIARAKYALPNLEFVCGDIATECFPPGSLDGIFDSSVLHHVSTFSGYDYGAVERAIEAQVRQLGDRGMLVIRDFVDPGSGDVILELPEGDGDDSDDASGCSTAALFRRFAREFRKLSPSPGFPFEELGASNGVRRFRVPKKIAAEFVLRKDYRADWDAEVLEEYTYFTQEEFERLFARLGLRIVASTPLWNPWIVRNRFEGKVRISTPEGGAVEYPPTNYVIVGEKVTAEEGVEIIAHPSVQPPSFLSMRHYRDVETGAVRDLVRRPHPTIDVVPWFESRGDVFVLGRKSYPRPILRCARNGARGLDRSTPPQYVTEPLNALQTEDPLGRTVEEVLERYASIEPSRIRSFRRGCVYYPSPGGIEEEVRSALVEIEPLFVQARIENLSGFSTSGQVRAIEATQLLRAAQVGGLPDNRLELNVHELLRRLGRAAGPWIGEEIDSPERLPLSRVSPFPEASDRARRRFVPASSAESSGFLDLHRMRFDECSAEGTVVGSQELEYVTPRRLSMNTIAVALLARVGDVIAIGVDDDDLPAVQSFTGNSGILVAPAWRLPREVESRAQALTWVAKRIRSEYGLEVVRFSELGGAYYPSAGLTPEIVHPLAATVRSAGASERPLLWLDLAETIDRCGELADAHLRTVAFRAAHALKVGARSGNPTLRQRPSSEG